MGYGFRLKAIASAGLSGLPEGEDGSTSEPIEFPTADGSSCAVAFTELESGRTVISMTGRGFDGEESARMAGLAARGALRYAALVTGLAIDFGHEPARGTRLSEAYRDKINDKAGGATVIGDAHGLTTWHDNESTELLVVGLRARGMVTHRADRLIEVLRDGLEGGRRLEGEAEALATDLYFLAEFETSDRARLLTLVTSLEVLSDQEAQPPAARALVRQFRLMARDEEEAAAAANDEDAARAFQSLVGSLGRLERESILHSLRRLMRETMYPTADADGDVEADVELAVQSYNARSTLVHDGREPDDVDLRQLSSDLRKLVGRLLRARAFTEIGSETEVRPRS